MKETLKSDPELKPLFNLSDSFNYGENEGFARAVFFIFYWKSFYI